MVIRFSLILLFLFSSCSPQIENENVTIENNYIEQDNERSKFILDQMKNSSNEVLVLEKERDLIFEKELEEANQRFIDIVNNSYSIKEDEVILNDTKIIANNS